MTTCPRCGTFFCGLPDCPNAPRFPDAPRCECHACTQARRPVMNQAAPKAPDVPYLEIPTGPHAKVIGWKVSFDEHGVRNRLTLQFGTSAPGIPSVVTREMTISAWDSALIIASEDK